MEEPKNHKEESGVGTQPLRKRSGPPAKQPVRSASSGPQGRDDRDGGGPRRRSWYQTHGRDLKFLTVFAVLMGLYYSVSTMSWAQDWFFPWYLLKNAEAAGAVVHAFGYDDVDVQGRALASPRGSISVERGCDAVEPAALFVSAVLASPVPLLSRLTAAVLGTFLLMLVNLVRIISLFLTNIHWKKAFDIMHLDVWQAAFILLAILLWAFWASWVMRRRTRRKKHASS